MKVSIERTASGYWNLLVDGEVHMAEESFGVVDGVRFALERPDSPMLDVLVPGELQECADSILKAQKRPSGA